MVRKGASRNTIKANIIELKRSGKTMPQSIDLALIAAGKSRKQRKLRAVRRKKIREMVKRFEEFVRK